MMRSLNVSVLLGWSVLAVGPVQAESTMGLYRDGQLVENLAMPPELEALEVQAASLNAAVSSTDDIPELQELRRNVLQSATSTSDQTKRRMASFDALAKHGVSLQKLLQNPQTGGREAFEALVQGFETCQRDCREHLAELREDIRLRGLPPEILERQEAVLATFDAMSLDSLQALEALVRDPSDLAALAEAKHLLDGFVHRGGPAHREPAPTVAKETRQAPQMTRAEADAMLEIAEDQGRSKKRVGPLASAPPIAITAAAGSNPPTAADLAGTADIQITQKIIDKAAELGNSPLAIYEYVRNQVKFQGYLGSRKGSDFTLRQMHGNDTDQCSLLLALLRAANVPCRYVRGSIELTPDQANGWLGTEETASAGSLLTTAGLDGVSIVNGPDIVAVRCTRMWVEAYVPYTNYRGTPNQEIGKAWIPMDPAFNELAVTPGEDVLTAMNVNMDTFLTNYINSAINPLSPIEQLESDIQSYLDTNDPGKTVDSIRRQVAINPLELGILPASLPYQVLNQGTPFAELEDNKRYKVRFHLYNGGATLIDHTLNLTEIVNKRLTFEYVGATPADQATIDSYGSIYETPPQLVNVVPILELDDVDIATSTNAIGLGRTHTSDMHFMAPLGASNSQPTVSNSMTAGNGQAIAFDTFLDAPPLLFQGAEISRPDFFEEMLYNAATDYLRTVDEGQAKAESLLGIVSVQDVSEAIVESSVSVSLSFGTPVTFEWTGLIVDADRRVVGPFPVDGNSADEIPYMKLSGYDGSFMEHRVFENSYESPAVSTIRAFHVATEQSIPICTISTSIAADCPGFSHGPSVTSAVNAALAQGHVVIIPESPMSYDQWDGTGYIDLDPATGAAGYIISGGINGNMSVSGGAIVDWLWPIFPPCLTLSSNGTATVLKPSADSPHSSALFCADDSYIMFEIEVTSNCLFGPNATATRTRTTHFTNKFFATYYGPGDYELYMSSFFFANPIQRKFTIIKPDISMQGLREESLYLGLPPHEENPGAYLCVNSDDDNNNGTPDKDESGPISGEDDLVPFNLRAGVGSVTTGMVRLEAPSGGSKIKVWENANKTGPINLPKSWAPGSVPTMLYAEAIDASSSEKDIKLRLLYTGSVPNCTDPSGLRDDVYLTAAGLQLNQVSFAGSKYVKLQDDSASMDYVAPHWVDNNGNLNAADSGEHNYSVAYRRNSTPKIGGKFILDGPSSGTSIKVRAIGSDGIRIPATSVSISGGMATLPETASSSPWPDTIRFYNRAAASAFALDWEYTFNGRQWCKIGKSKHQVYLTLDDPGTTMRQETLFFLGSKNANGKNSGGDAFTAIWGGFSSRSVSRVDGVQMKYWNPPPGACQTLLAMLADPTGNGTCIAWATLLRETANAQGIPGAQIYQLTPIYTNDPGTAGDSRGLMLVKDWVFDPTGTAPAFMAPFTHLSGEYSDDPNGAPGQGNPNPPGGFFNHFIVKYDGKYYDPSYGGLPYSSKEAWEDASLDGFSKVFRVIAGGTPLDLRAAKPNSTGLETSFTPFP